MTLFLLLMYDYVIMQIPKAASLQTVVSINTCFTVNSTLGKSIPSMSDSLRLVLGVSRAKLSSRVVNVISSQPLAIKRLQNTAEEQNCSSWISKCTTRFSCTWFWCLCALGIMQWTDVKWHVSRPLTLHLLTALVKKWLLLKVAATPRVLKG